MNTQDDIDYIKCNSNELGDIFSPERLEEFNQNVNHYMDILKDELKVSGGALAHSKSMIAEYTNLIDENEAIVEVSKIEISKANADMKFCEDLLPDIKTQHEKALLGIKVTELVSNAQTFEEALKTRLERYKQELQESSFLGGVDNDFNMEKVFETALTFMTRSRTGGYNPDWSSVKANYNDSIRELCELEAQGKIITLSKSKSRFDIIDRLIAKYEDKLFLK
jgi:hypothetical protein